MRIDQLIYLMDIAQTGSISATAQRVFLSQQTVSEAIRSLERELGHSLLKRSKTGVTLTPKGELALEYADNIVQQYRTLLSELEKAEIYHDFPEEIFIAASPMLANSIMPGVQNYLQRSDPDLKIHFKNEVGDRMIDSILEKNIHIGFCYYTSMEDTKLAMLCEQHPSLEIKKVYATPIVYCVRKDSAHFFRQELSDEMISDVAKKLIIFFSADYAPDQKTILQQLAENHMQYGSFLFSDDIVLIRDLILRYDAFCAMPELTYRMFFNYREYTAIPFNEKIFDNLYCIYDGECYETYFDVIIVAMEREIRHILRNQLIY